MIERRRPKFFSTIELCELFDCTRTYFDSNVKPFIPAKAIDKSDKTHVYHGRTTIDVYCSRRKRASAKTAEFGDIDSSTGLTVRERLITEQYEIAEMRKLQMKHDLMPTKRVEESLGRLQTMLRELGDQLKRSVGQKAVDLLNETLTKYSREVAELWERAWKKSSQ